jgi:putative endonuclease
MTNNIRRRIAEHKTKAFKSTFTKRYNCDHLLYYEEQPTFEDAIRREQDIKHLRREYKMQLITRINPDLVDLAGKWRIS